MNSSPSAPKSLAVFDLEEAAVAYKTLLVSLDYFEKTVSITGGEMPDELSRWQDLCRQIVFEIERGALADVPRIKELNQQLGQVLPGQMNVRILF